MYIERALSAGLNYTKKKRQIVGAESPLLFGKKKIICVKGIPRSGRNQIFNKTAAMELTNIDDGGTFSNEVYTILLAMIVISKQE